MKNLNINSHISGQFNSELESVRNQVMQMGGLIEQQLNDALTAMADDNIELAEKIILRDQQVNEFESNVDRECSRIIAKRHPAASDLRWIFSIMKTITELERIGDSVSTIAQLVIENHNRDYIPLLIGLKNYGLLVLKRLHDVLDTFIRLDIKAAIVMHNADNKFKQHYEGVVRDLMSLMIEEPASVPFILKVLNSAHSIERIADRCQNICEQVVYLVKAVDVRHATHEELNRYLGEPV